ncbi:MAG: 5-methyltetrahydropteroyltriglutamate--homocysteine S-methyltransferase [Burkholderiales bacterium]|nr:5-methyltetrahydropteroyltriglutamate--homocysteine S-methyltransferase [Burkholderiales bacterium]
MSATPPFRADHVGSLLRPEALREAFKRRARRQIDDAEFGAIQDAAIRDALRLQEDVGLEVATDGEFRRGSYWGHWVDKVEGFGIRTAAFRFHDDHGHEAEFTAADVRGPLRRARGISTDEFAFVAANTRLTPKITMPSPSTLHFYGGADCVSPAAYPDYRAYLADLARIFREEIAALGALGCRHIQLDEVPLAMLCDPAVRDTVRAQGLDWRELVDQYIRTTNDALRGRPAGMTTAMHLCRGNFKGHYLSAGGYESVAERLFNDLDIDVFLLEYDTDRAGDFAPLRHVPKHRSVSLGLITTKSAALEPVDLLRRRIDLAATHIDLAQLGICPQCGFASTVGGNDVTRDDEIAKLALLTATARAVWGEA